MQTPQIFITGGRCEPADKASEAVGYWCLVGHCEMDRAGDNVQLLVSQLTLRLGNEDDLSTIAVPYLLAVLHSREHARQTI